MILFANLIATENRARYNRGLLPWQDRVHVMLYMLASMSVFNWSKIILMVKPDYGMEHRFQEIEGFSKTVFDNTKLEIFSWRCERQSDYQEIFKDKIKDLEDKYIWFLGNDDHIYISPDTSLINRGLEYLNNYSSAYKSVYTSHWPEHYRIAHNPNMVSNTVIHNDGWISYDQANRDSIQIITKETFEHWWFSEDYGDLFLPRADWAHLHRAGPVQRIFCPPREICRHFDGYQHIGMCINEAPPLTIPEGFFDFNIKVRIGYQDNKLGWVNMNPLNQNHKTVDNNGTDYKWIEEDIPLFWKHRISELDINKNIDYTEHKKARNYHTKKLATTTSYHHDVDNKYTPGEDWLKFTEI